MGSKAYIGQAADPSTRTCEWCPNTAIHSLEITKKKDIGKALFIYYCGDHRTQAWRFIHGDKDE